jgi:hypothetical protein
VAKKTTTVPASNTPASKVPSKPAKASKSSEPAPAPTKSRKAPAVAQEPAKGRGRKPAATIAANTSAAPVKGKRKKEEAPPAAQPSKGKGRKTSAQPAPAEQPAKNGKRVAQIASEPAPPLREINWIPERIHVVRTMRKMRATTPARARTAEDIAIEAEVTPFRVKEMGYRGNSTRGQIGKDASPLVLHGLIGIADASQLSSDYSAGGRGLHYYLTDKGASFVLPGDKPARAKKWTPLPISLPRNPLPLWCGIPGLARAPRECSPEGWTMRVPCPNCGRPATWDDDEETFPALVPIPLPQVQSGEREVTAFACKKCGWIVGFSASDFDRGLSVLYTSNSEWPAPPPGLAVERGLVRAPIPRKELPMSDPTRSPAQLAAMASRAAALYRAAHAADNAPGAPPEAGLEDALRAEKLVFTVLSATIWAPPESCLFEPMVALERGSEADTPDLAALASACDTIAAALRSIREGWTMRYFLCARDSWDGALLYAAPSDWSLLTAWTEYRSEALRFDRSSAIARLRCYFDPTGKPLTSEPLWIERAD